MTNIKVDALYEFKKSHSCGSNEWRVLKVGADVKLKCTNCNHIILMSRFDFNKKRKVY